MKRLHIITVMTLAMLCVCAMASASTTTPLPEEISSYLTTGNLEGATILDTADLAGYGSDDCWFAAIRTAGGNNYLYCFKQQSDGTWKQQFHTSGAIPQTKHGIQINVSTSGLEWPTDEAYNTPMLFVGQENVDGEYWEFCVTYELTNHQWLIHRITSYTGYEHMRFFDGSIAYYHDIESDVIAGFANGDLQRDLRYVYLNGIPKTLAEARNSLTVAPNIPVSEELRVYPVSFTGAKKYAVYSAPDEQSIRANNGKAVVSTNSWIQVFGTDGDWVLIQYSIDTSHYRFGYITKKSLPSRANVPALPLTRTISWTTANTVMTDDPLYSRSALLSLPEGTQVTWLATMGEWAYVEVDQNDLARGFVPVMSINYYREFNLRNQPDGNGRPVFDGTITLTHDDRLEASIGIAQEGSLGNAAVAKIRIWDGENLMAVLQPAADGRFNGGFGLGGDITSVTIEALDPSDNTLASIRVDW